MTQDQKLVANFYETFGNKAKGRLVDIQDGPIVCTFVFEPDDAASISKLLKAIKETNNAVLLPYNNRMIIQITKEERKNILFTDLIETPVYKQTSAILPMILGVDTAGETVVKDLIKMPHLLVTGRTGCGKSVCLMAMLKSITTKLSPEECKLVIFDPISCDYPHCWNQDEHMLWPVITAVDFKKIDLIMKIIDDRYQTLVDNGVSNVLEYREKNHKQDMPYIVIAMDELAYYMQTNKRHTERFVKAVCGKGRAVGVHLILATQRPDKENLTLTIKACFPSQLCFHAVNTKDSIQMFGEPGAEKLLACGDMLYGDAGRVPVRIHCAYLTDDDVTRTYQK